MTKKNILKILEKEDIRWIDGRHSKGFVELNELPILLLEGSAEVYENQGMKFVRLKEKKKSNI